MKFPIPQQEVPAVEQDEVQSSDDEIDPLDVKKKHVVDDMFKQAKTVGVFGMLYTVPRNVDEARNKSNLFPKRARTVRDQNRNAGKTKI